MGANWAKRRGKNIIVEHLLWARPCALAILYIYSSTLCTERVSGEILLRESHVWTITCLHRVLEDVNTGLEFSPNHVVQLTTHPRQ